MSRLRVAICGAGIGAEHLQGYLANPDLYEVVCIADPDEERASSLQKLAGCSYEQGYAAALQRSDVQLMDICLPPQLHKQAIIESLNAGKHVICEKPLVTSLADMDQIMDQAERATGRVVPVFQYRFGNGLSQLASLMAAGLTGKPLIATVETHWHRDAEYYAVPWRGKWATELGGVIVSHAIHAHDLLVQVMGSVKDVQAQLTTRVNPVEVEDCAAIVFGMQSGALATSSVTLGSAVDQSRLRFCFANLTAESSLSAYNPGTAPWTFTARDPAIESQMHEIVDAHHAHAEGFARQLELAHGAFMGESDAPVSLTDARTSLELITALYQASRSASRVSLPLPRSAPGYSSWLPEVL